MINVNDLRKGVIFEDDGQIYEVLTYEHMKQGRGSGNINVKARNVRSGAIIERSFITGARVQDITTEKRKATYLYESGENVVFMDTENYEQYEIPKKLLGDQMRFLQEGMPAQIQMLEDEALTVDLPNNAEFAVRDAGASAKGNSVSNVWKKATLENGVQVDVPLFIKDGDRVKVDLRTGQYVERAK